MGLIIQTLRMKIPLFFLLVFVALTLARKGPKCSDGERPTCADGSTPQRPPRPQRGPPVCDDGSNPVCSDGNPPSRPALMAVPNVVEVADLPVLMEAGLVEVVDEVVGAVVDVGVVRGRWWWVEAGGDGGGVRILLD